MVAVDHGEIRIPNWAVTRKAGGGTHAVWNLARPVHRGERARPSPLRALARVSEYYAAALLADAGYTGVLSHNPMSAAHGPGFVTNWLRRDPTRSLSWERSFPGAGESLRHRHSHRSQLLNV